MILILLCSVYLVDQAHYGRKDPSSEAKVKEIFKSSNIDLPQRFEEYEAKTYESLNKLIQQIDDHVPRGLKQEVFKTFLAKIYKRSK